ncbi:hypothetical protein [Pseudomonas sp. ICMP22404]|nr:hypothetical protein [Pseudomonas sp. ICMP22404]
MELVREALEKTFSLGKIPEHQTPSFFDEEKMTFAKAEHAGKRKQTSW